MPTSSWLAHFEAWTLRFALGSVCRLLGIHLRDWGTRLMYAVMSRWAARWAVVQAVGMLCLVALTSAFFVYLTVFTAHVVAAHRGLVPPIPLPSIRGRDTNRKSRFAPAA